MTMFKYFFDNQEIGEFLPSSFLSAVKPVSAAMSAFSLLLFFLFLFLLVNYIKKSQKEPSPNLKFSLAIMLLILPYLSFMLITVDYRFYPIEKTRLLTSNYFQSLDNYSKNYFKSRLTNFGYNIETGEFDQHFGKTIYAPSLDRIITSVKKKQAELSITNNDKQKM